MTDNNKDEASRCVRIAEAAIASGDRERALKFIKIARRLDHSAPVESLLAACEKLNNIGAKVKVTREEILGMRVPKDPSSSKSSPGATDREQNYTEEDVKLIREISRSKDYYAVLSLERRCTVEEIRRAYRKLSLKVHPDKNKAPGAEEAFKIICKAFKCLSDEESRRVYDQRGSVGDFGINQHYGAMRRRRTRAPTRNDIFDEDFDTDEVFWFFGYQGDMFQTPHVHRERRTAHQRRNSNTGAEGVGLLTLIQILPIFIIFLILFLPYSEPEYFLRQTYTYHISKITENHGVEYYVRSADFDQKYPEGSSSREKLEDEIFWDYKNVLKRSCHVELQRRQRLTNYPTPYCDKLRNLIAA